MVGIQDDHLGRAPRFAAALDDAGEGVKALHETEGAGSAASAGKDGILLAERGQIGARAGTPFEQHAFGFGQVQDRRKRVFHRDDKAGRTLRPRLAALQLADGVRGLVVVPAVTTCLLHANVEPNRGVEAGLLRQHEVGQFQAEVLGVLRRGEVLAVRTPIGDGIHHAMDQLRNAVLALGRPELAMEVLAGHDVGGGLRPVGGDLDIALLENYRALFVSNRSGAQIPLNFIVGSPAGFKPGSEVAGERDTGTRRFRRSALELLSSGAEVDA